MATNTRRMDCSPDDVFRVLEDATVNPRFLTDPLLRARNAETLRRLAYIAEGRATSRKKDTMSTNSHRNDISTESSPGPDDHDNLGAEDGKGTPPTVPPTGRDETHEAEGNQREVRAEDPDQG